MWRSPVVGKPICPAAGAVLTCDHDRSALSVILTGRRGPASASHHRGPARRRDALSPPSAPEFAWWPTGRSKPYLASMPMRLFRGGAAKTGGPEKQFTTKQMPIPAMASQIQNSAGGRGCFMRIKVPQSTSVPTTDVQAPRHPVHSDGVAPAAGHELEFRPERIRIPLACLVAPPPSKSAAGGGRSPHDDPAGGASPFPRVTRPPMRFHLRRGAGTAVNDDRKSKLRVDSDNTFSRLQN